MTCSFDRPRKTVEDSYEPISGTSAVAVFDDPLDQRDFGKWMTSGDEGRLIRSDFHHFVQ